MELGLQGKVVLVEASTEGLGFATARVLVAEGARVWIGSRDAAKVAHALEALRAVPGGGFADGATLDVSSAARVIRAALPGLSVRGGSILVCSSTSVKEPIAGLILSNSLRSATVAMAKTLSVELAPQGIRVNCLAPGRFGTGRLEQLDKATAARAGASLEATRAKAVAAIPLGRYGDPEEFGKAACWLLSPAASYMTGQVVTLDGGQVKGCW
jgi:3-oxoacyl-[acyl-carrier protein] reductase